MDPASATLFNAAMALFRNDWVACEGRKRRPVERYSSSWQIRPAFADWRDQFISTVGRDRPMPLRAPFAGPRNRDQTPRLRGRHVRDSSLPACEPPSAATLRPSSATRSRRITCTEPAPNCLVLSKAGVRQSSQVGVWKTSLRTPFLSNSQPASSSLAPSRRRKSSNWSTVCTAVVGSLIAGDKALMARKPRPT
jgi:hypothetical protein